MINTLIKSFYIKNMIALGFALLILLGSVVNSYLNYQMNKQVLYKNIDDTLLSSAYNIDLLLEDGFHDRALERESISEEEDIKNMYILSKFVKNSQIEYVYSMIQKDGDIYFTTSSATDKEISENDTTVYYDLYDEATPNLKDAIKNKKVFYEESTDKWGTFRSVFIPCVTKNGNSYILGADIKIDFINETLSKYIKKAVLTQSILALILIILAMLYLKISTKELDNIKTLKIKLDEEILKKTEALSDLNSSLEKRVEEELAINRQKDKQLMNQSRLAQMGEMISMIAHQWRQPLSAISAVAINLKLQIELEEYNFELKEERDRFNKVFSEELDHIGNFVQSLTETIDDFRNFYKPNKQSENTSFKEVITKALNIIKNLLESESVEVLYDYKLDSKRDIYINEMMQVIMNIIKNAQDNFKEKNIKNPQIRISAFDGGISICDNGGGIPEEIIENIFDPYFSTKDEKNGTGLGLYMCKIIIEEHHNGSLSVKNSDEGTCFIIKL